MAEPTTRLHLGNLPYVAQRNDIEDFFASNNVAIKKVDITTDPLTGRNPSYCFVDFHSEDDAARAMQDLQGMEIRGRSVKINPKTERTTGGRYPAKVWDRDWSRKEDPSMHVREHTLSFERRNRPDAPSHSSVSENEKRRIWVGGLPNMVNQNSLDAEMRDLFGKFHVESVGKLITPAASQNATSGSHSFCFVDLASALEAQEAIESLNGKQNPYGGIYVIRLSQRRAPNPSTTTIPEREQETASARVFVGNLPYFDDQAVLENEIRHFFQAFAVQSVTKLFKPSRAEEGGNHHFCFVELESAQEAQKAIEALGNTSIQDGAAYTVRMARPPPANVTNGTIGGHGRTEQRKPQGAPRDFGASWRRKD